MTTRWIADYPASARYPTYTRANAGEVMPDPVSPLSATAGLAAAGELGWRDAYVQAGSMSDDEYEPDRPNTVGIFGGYLYLNMSLTCVTISGARSRKPCVNQRSILALAKLATPFCRTSVRRSFQDFLSAK